MNTFFKFKEIEFYIFSEGGGSSQDVVKENHGY